MCDFALYNENHLSEQQNFYTGDEVLYDLSDVVGAVVQDDPTVLVFVSLVENGVEIISDVPVLDGQNQSNFTAGEVCALIDSATVDPLTRTRYQILIRLRTAGGTQRTFITRKIVYLLSI